MSKAGSFPADRANAFIDFCRFSRRQLETQDIDPMYPVLRQLYAAEGLDRDTSLWRTYLYVAFYKIASAEEAWAEYPTPQLVDPSPSFRKPTGFERRGFRGNDKAAYNVNDAFREARRHGSFLDWVSAAVGSGGEAGWDRLRIDFQRISGNGPWASYKWADLIKNVHGFPVVASDIGVGGASATAGPIPGMIRLTGQPWQICATDTMLQRSLLRQAQAAGVPFDGLDQLETCLCDFNTLCKGNYYSGHDIDAMMGGLLPGSAVWAARRQAFAPALLGELNDWTGVRKDLLRLYSEQGLLI